MTNVAKEGDCSCCCCCCDDDCQDERLHHLPHWAPVTNRLLECGGSMAWNVLDHAIPKPDDFVEKLRCELNDKQQQSGGGFLQRLQPARTQGQIQAQEVISLLTRFTNATTIKNTEPDGLTLIMEQAARGNPINQVRGDYSIFISREERCRSDFVKLHPYLVRLIQTVERTVIHQLSNCIDFDPNQTSVQLARYPGDGQSGYPRHCDREFCQEEAPTDNTVKGASNHQRIITCVYYLTPDDWNVKRDGGCLRLFNTSSTEWFDVAPYSNRLVIFRSDGVEHQVLPSLRRPRTALTIWLYGSIKGDKRTPLPAPQSDISHVLKGEGVPQSATPAMNISVKDTLGPPPLGVTSSDNSRFKIFVSIAAFRDSETAPTILSLMKSAQHPDRIFVGLVLQIDTSNNQSEDQHIVLSLQEMATTTPWYNAHVRTITMDARHAQGPCYARYLCQSLHRGEDYVLQIDSHMRFRNNWDSYLIEQLQACSSSSNRSKVMLTGYPVGYQLPNQIPNECRGTLLVPWKFDSQGMLRQRGRLLRETSDSQPIPCLLYAAGFNFAPASVLEDCPYQLILRHLFFGEELSMAVRLYTWGYDLFAPSESVCYHLWSRAHRPTTALSTSDGGIETEAEKEAARGHSQRIVLDQLEGRGPGLGSVRSAHDFAVALKVDFDKHRLEGDAELGGLSMSSFLESDVFASANQLEKKVFQLEPQAQNLIASFLEQLG